MMRTRVVPASGYFISILLGCVLFWLVCGDPFSVIEGGFMIDTDYPNAAAAYEIFVRSGWTWPLGEIQILEESIYSLVMPRHGWLFRQSLFMELLRGYLSFIGFC